MELRGVDGSEDQLVFLGSEDGACGGRALGAIPKKRRRRKMGRAERIYDEVEQDQDGLARQAAGALQQQGDQRAGVASQQQHQQQGRVGGNSAKGAAVLSSLQSELQGAYAKMRAKQQVRNSEGDEVEMTSFGSG